MADGRVHLAWADRTALRWTALAFSALAALVLVSSMFAAVVWWQVGGREGLHGAGRLVPALAALVVGGLTSLCLYGLSRVCRTVTRLCAAPSPEPRHVSHQYGASRAAVAGRATASTGERPESPVSASR